jgi:hypothetical protein
LPVFNVHVIQDDALPVAQDWAMVDDGGHVMLFVKRSALGPEVMADAHAAFWRLRRKVVDTTISQVLAAGS